MTVDTVSYGTVPFGTLFAGYIGRNAMVSPFGCCHTFPEKEKENILANLLRKCAEYLAVWKIRINTHTHTHTHAYIHTYIHIHTHTYIYSRAYSTIIL